MRRYDHSSKLPITQRVDLSVHTYIYIYIERERERERWCVYTYKTSVWLIRRIGGVLGAVAQSVDLSWPAGQQDNRLASESGAPRRTTRNEPAPPPQTPLNFGIRYFNFPVRGDSHTQPPNEANSHPGALTTN